MTDNVDRDIERAAKSYKRSDEGRWAAAYFASRIVGRHEPGATLALASRMGVSPDTIENLAHAYILYNDLRQDKGYRFLVNKIRKMPYIYYSYFRALYKAREDYHLNNAQVMSILVDMLQAEGSLSNRDLDGHIRDRFGDTRDWSYYATRAFREIGKTLQQPDLPKEVRDTLNPAYNILGKEA